jgi:hypothetical protein
VGAKDTSFYNPTRRVTIAITASIEKDHAVYTKIKSDLSDIFWRQYYIIEIENYISTAFSSQ